MAPLPPATQTLVDPLSFDWDRIYQLAGALIERTHLCSRERPLFGVPTGGSLVALIVRELVHARSLGKLTILNKPVPGCLVVDDIVDSGATLLPYLREGYDCEALIRSRRAPSRFRKLPLASGWVRFPWEKAGGDPTDNIRRLLQYLGEDPDRDGLRQTPARVVKALDAMTEGRHDDPARHLTTSFQAECDEMVLMRGIRFTSVCEHHLLPFFGTVDLAYLPDGHVVGLSKLVRMVRDWAKRLQIQERLTQQIAQCLQRGINARGVACIIRAKHACMICRGVTEQDADVVTSAMLGQFRRNTTLRAELLRLM